MRTLRQFTLPTLLLLISLRTWAEKRPCYGPPVNAAPAGPTVTDATDTIPCGVIAVDWSWVRSWPGSGNNTDAFNIAFRTAVSDNVELRWSTDASLLSRDRLGRHSGIGDSYIGVKFRWVEQSRRRPSFAARYVLKVPFASESKGLGSGTHEHELALLASKDFRNIHIDFAVLETIGAISRDGGVIPATRLALAIYRPVTTRITAMVEGYKTPIHRDRPDASGAMIGLQSRLHPTTHIYTAVDFGLTDTGHRKRLLIGISITPLSRNALRQRPVKISATGDDSNESTASAHQ